MTEIQMIDRQGVAPFLEQKMPQQMKESLDGVRQYLKDIVMLFWHVCRNIDRI